MTTKYLDSELNRSVGEKNLVLSYGKKYDSRDYTQIDKESYLFLSYKDGVFVNLYDLKIDTVLNSYVIPTNSIIYFSSCCLRISRVFYRIYNGKNL